jgi:plastocyanin
MFVAAVGALTLAASPALGASQSVSANGTLFIPNTVTVNPGDSVSWTNVAGTHDVTFDDGSFTQPNPPSASAWTVTRTFATLGTHRYYCSIHGFTGGVGMSGTVVVSEAPAGGGGGGTSPTGAGPTGTGPAGLVGAQGQSTSCKSQRNFRIRIRQPRGTTIRSAEVSVNGKPVKVSKLVVGGKLRHTAPVDLRGLGKGIYEVRIVATTSAGKKLRGTRTYRTCDAKLTTSALPPL